MQAHGDRRSSGRAHRGQKELALVGAARLLHCLVLHGAALGLLVLVRSLRLPAILLHVLVLDGRRAAALLAHLTLPDVVVHAAGHESRASKSVCSRVSAPQLIRGSSLLTVAQLWHWGNAKASIPGHLWAASSSMQRYPRSSDTPASSSPCWASRTSAAAASSARGSPISPSQGSSGSSSSSTATAPAAVRGDGWTHLG